MRQRLGAARFSPATDSHRTQDWERLARSSGTAAIWRKARFPPVYMPVFRYQSLGKRYTQSDSSE